jgi:molybdopterin/thiamine biosynthesis adenylyltransferase
MKLTNEHLTRQLDILPVECLGMKITIIGAGAIGGWTTLALAKMGFSDLTVFDHDRVDIVNLNSQFYRFSDIGKLKVQALHDLVLDFTGVAIDAVPTRYAAGCHSGIVVSAVDSMAVRKLIWDEHKDRSPGTKAIVDPRMGAETALLYVMNPMSGVDQQAYERSLYGDSEALQEACTAKATMYTASMLSGLVCKAVKDLVTTQTYLRTAQWDIAKNEFLGFSRGAS